MVSTIVLVIVFATLCSAVPNPKTWRAIEPIYPELEAPSHPLDGKPSGRIVGGSIADPHSFPHQVALFLHKQFRSYFCGGSLISLRYVLNAAHCTDAAISIDVVLAAHNIRDETEPSQLLITTTDYVIHEDYDATWLRNDISIIRLPQGAVTMSDIIGTVGLPRWSDVGKDLTGKRGVVSGWGRIKDSEISYTDYLQYVELSVISNDVCDEWYFGGTIKDGHLCTSGENGRSPCNGDSGGALVADGRQFGIVSFGSMFGCASGFPAAFTRVTEYLQWIQDHSDVTIEA